MCKPQDLSPEISKLNFGVFKHVKMEDCLPMNSMIPEAGAHYHEETDDSELSESEKHEAHAAQGMDAPAKKRKIWRVMLSPSQALEIYNRRPPLKELHGKCGYAHGSMRNARIVAEDYNVSAKTIRDIWNRYSWAKVTRPLWTEPEAKHYAETYTVRGHQGVAALSGRRGSDTHMEFAGGASHDVSAPSMDALANTFKVENANSLASLPASLPAFSSSPGDTKLPRIQTIESLLAPFSSLSSPPSTQTLALPLPSQLQQPSIFRTLFQTPASSSSSVLEPTIPALPLSLPLPTSGPSLQYQIDASTQRLQQLISLNQRCLDQRLNIPLIPPLPLPRV
mmetsp:Transcript_37364/g.88329  ORF Transcript_37364/g.88329 Transcript_37364/m.88329 type:complete len:337 (-) Transcript_37364:88-1098(-)|eukprot:CAMPEP_0177690596 /NCGR_PEP_ID=MMETSP0484_2-20121128/853_1 /TAXON_ID=354590 /ORGANISM="Rhodomonas lens, Strain RHODO" /LENGTH=336 /DNA_ID=CAMNT_0019201155 /DNA_START=148 /DNA_END=1158 /DNA_ORIENTATION=+